MLVEITFHFGADWGVAYSVVRAFIDFKPASDRGRLSGHFHHSILSFAGGYVWVFSQSFSSVMTNVVCIAKCVQG